jgi:sugar porter (SP) family MFS transporter
LSDWLGRRRILLAAATLFCLSSLGTALPRNLNEFVIARLIAGTAIGVASVLAPMYIAEVSPARIRGRLVSLNQMAIVTGILCAYFVSWLLSHFGAAGWRWMFATAALPSFLFFVGLLFIPESPRWLIRRGRDDEALPVLEKIGGAAEAHLEVAAIRASLAEESGSWREILAPNVRRPLLIAASLAVLSQITGINTVIYYGSILFKEHAGSASTSSAIGANVVIGLTNFLCTILAIGMIDKLGRKPLLLIGSAGMAAALGLLGLAFWFSPPPGNLILILVLVYVAFFAVGLGPATWVYIAELFPTAIRGRAMSAATLCVWVACLLVTLTFLSLVRALGPSGAFWLYGSLCAATFLFVHRFLPETRGRTLEEIQHMWKK